MVCGFEGFTLLSQVLFYGALKSIHAYTQKTLLDAAVHSITLPQLLRTTLYGGVAILLSSVSRTPQYTQTHKHTRLLSP